MDEQKNYQLSQSELDIIQLHFDYIKLIGKGSFGKVILAQDRTSGEQIAIKLIHKRDVDEISTLMREVKILKTLSHVNIVEYKGFIETDHYILLCMEFVRGGTLRDFIDYKKTQNLKCTEEEAATIIKALLNGINYLHENNIVHRDLKPGKFLMQQTF